MSVSILIKVARTRLFDGFYQVDCCVPVELHGKYLSEVFVCFSDINAVKFAHELDKFLVVEFLDIRRIDCTPIMNALTTNNHLYIHILASKHYYLVLFLPLIQFDLILHGLQIQYQQLYNLLQATKDPSNPPYVETPYPI